MEREVRYCMTSDGVRIAYTVSGKGPPLVLVAEPITSHTQLEWSQPVIRNIQGELSRRHTLVRFDTRGSGLSDRVLPQTIEETALDIEAVVERTGLSEFALGAIQIGSPGAIVYAAKYPERITRMFICDGFARMRDIIATPPAQALTMAARLDWVTATEAMGSTVFGAGREESRGWGTYIRSCIGAELFSEEYQALIGEFDASEAACRIEAPTLVMKHEGIAFVTMEMAKDLSARIPNAQLVIVPGTWADDTEAIARRWSNFVNDEQEPVRPDPTVPSGMTAILFADIADSTGLTERLGDAAFRAKARDLDAALRAVIREQAGTAIEGKLLGDGVLAVFTSARQAIEAALACASSGDAAGLPLHLGLHAGDVIREENNVYGGAVNIASRISGLSAPGEVLVSETVRSLARTSAGVRFEDRGEQALKGVGEAVRVWAVRQGE
jgi:class 3 adenylate cyclase